MNPEESISRQERMISTILEVRKLVHRCVELNAELQNQKRLNSEQESMMTQLQAENVQRDGLIALGKREMQRRKEEILTCLRAIVHHTGDRQRLHRMERLLESDDLLPEEISRWHQKLSEEFQLLYPTRPISHPVEFQEGTGSIKTDWTVFRISRK